MQLSVFCGVSVDGFLARGRGSAGKTVDSLYAGRDDDNTKTLRQSPTENSVERVPQPHNCEDQAVKRTIQASGRKFNLFGIAVLFSLLMMSGCVQVLDLRSDPADLAVLPSLPGEYFNAGDGNYACIAAAAGRSYQVWENKNRSYGSGVQRMELISLGTEPNGAQAFLGIYGGQTPNLFELLLENGQFQYANVKLDTGSAGALDFVQRMKAHGLVMTDNATLGIELRAVSGSPTSAQLSEAFRDPKIRERLLADGSWNHFERVTVNFDCATHIG